VSSFNTFTDELSKEIFTQNCCTATVFYWNSCLENRAKKLVERLNEAVKFDTA